MNAARENVVFLVPSRSRYERSDKAGTFDLTMDLDVCVTFYGER